MRHFHTIVILLSLHSQPPHSASEDPTEHLLFKPVSPYSQGASLPPLSLTCPDTQETFQTGTSPSHPILAIHPFKCLSIQLLLSQRSCLSPGPISCLDFWNSLPVRFPPLTTPSNSSSTATIETVWVSELSIWVPHHHLYAHLKILECRPPCRNQILHSCTLSNLHLSWSAPFQPYSAYSLHISCSALSNPLPTVL